MWILKKYRDGVCTTTERHQEKSKAIANRKAYEKSYNTHQKKERKIYGKIIFKEIS